MIAMTLAEVAQAVSGALVNPSGDDGESGVGDRAVTGAVEFDSRAVGPGGLFVAFAGERSDGHDFAGTAFAAGAVGVLGSRPVDGPTVVVVDPLAAMGALARTVLDRLPDLSVIGITGSSGKTSTKDLIGQLTGRLGETVAPAGSFNNELGLPHTALRAGPSTRFLVLEMGARGIGHLAYLCRIAPPRVAVVVNVGVAHIGEFGSVEAIATAKVELVEALPAAGLAVLNADDQRVRAMAGHTSARVLLAGEAPDADVRAVDVTLDQRGRPAYTLVTPEGTAAVQLGVSGRHQVTNSLLAAAVAWSSGMPTATLADALGQLRLVSTRRMDIFDRPDGITVIDDSYNANPASMEAALRALRAVGEGRRTVAVLGYMAELGEHERSGHSQVGRITATLGVDHLVVVGADAAGIIDGAQTVSGWSGSAVLVTDQEAALSLLRAELRPGDVVLVKGSRYRTWDVVDGLREAKTSPASSEQVGAP